jgi:uncharacterized protein HemX
MFTVFKEYLAVIKFAIMAVAALAVLVFYEGIPFVLQGRVTLARQDGARQERILWEEARRKMIAQNEAARKAAQAEIDRIEAETSEQQRRASEAEAALDEAIHAQEVDTAPGAPFFPKRLSDALRSIGR